jgi:hypothetical protein
MMMPRRRRQLRFDNFILLKNGSAANAAPAKWIAICCNILRDAVSEKSGGSLILTY